VASIRVFLLAWAVIFSFSSVADARDCSISKEFQIKKAQALAGVLQDPSGAVLPGIDLQLLSGNRVVHHVTTTNEGAYDFGSIAPGKYRIRVASRGGTLCALKIRCTEKEGCVIESRLTISSKWAVKVN
jgi:hypothetical protein